MDKSCEMGLSAFRTLQALLLKQSVFYSYVIHKKVEYEVSGWLYT